MRWREKALIAALTIGAVPCYAYGVPTLGSFLMALAVIVAIKRYAGRVVEAVVGVQVPGLLAAGEGWYCVHGVNRKYRVGYVFKVLDVIPGLDALEPYEVGTKARGFMHMSVPVASAYYSVVYVNQGGELRAYFRVAVEDDDRDRALDRASRAASLAKQNLERLRVRLELAGEEEVKLPIRAEKLRVPNLALLASLCASVAAPALLPSTAPLSLVPMYFLLRLLGTWRRRGLGVRLGQRVVAEMGSYAAASNPSDVDLKFRAANVRDILYSTPGLVFIATYQPAPPAKWAELERLAKRIEEHYLMRGRAPPPEVRMIHDVKRRAADGQEVLFRLRAVALCDTDAAASQAETILRSAGFSTAPSFVPLSEFTCDVY